MRLSVTDFLFDSVPVSVGPMKLRIFDSTVRIRMLPPELASWQSAGHWAEGVQIGPSTQDRWSYRLELSSGPDWSAAAEPGHLVVAVPREAVRDWADSEATTLEYLTPWGTRLILEKDLPRRLLRPEKRDT
jgi:hypothetical protein